MSKELGNLPHEKLLRLLQISAQTLLATFDEPLAIMYAVAWQPPLGNDLPFGGVIIRKGQSGSVSTMGNCLVQSNKLIQHIHDSLHARIEQVTEEAAQEYRYQRDRIEKMKATNAASVQPTPKESHNGEEETRSDGDGISITHPGGVGHSY